MSGVGTIPRHLVHIPCELACGTGPAGIFLFRLARQTDLHAGFLTKPFTELHRIIPAHTCHRVIFGLFKRKVPPTDSRRRVPVPLTCASPGPPTKWKLGEPPQSSLPPKPYITQHSACCALSLRRPPYLKVIKATHNSKHTISTLVAARIIR